MPGLRSNFKKFSLFRKLLCLQGPNFASFIKTHVMFRKLRDKWGVSALRLFLILCTFAIGGSLSGYAARKLLQVMEVEQGALWVIAYVLLITLLWPLAVLLVSIPFGQLGFFRKYLVRIGKKLFGRKSNRSRNFSIAP